MFTAVGPTPPPGLTFVKHVCVWRRGEVVSKPSVGSSEVQLGAVSSLAGFPPDGDGRALALSRHGLQSPSPAPRAQPLAGVLGSWDLLQPHCLALEPPAHF